MSNQLTDSEKGMRVCLGVNLILCREGCTLLCVVLLYYVQHSSSVCKSANTSICYSLLSGCPKRLISDENIDRQTYKADFAYIYITSHPPVPPTNISVVNNCGESFSTYSLKKVYMHHYNY